MYLLTWALYHRASNWHEQHVLDRGADGADHTAAYRYRKFKVSADTELVVRCEIDGVLKHKGQDELLSVKALNEFDPKLTGQTCKLLRL